MLSLETSPQLHISGRFEPFRATSGEVSSVSAQVTLAAGFRAGLAGALGVDSSDDGGRVPICFTANGSGGAADPPTLGHSYERRSRRLNARRPLRGLTVRATSCGRPAKSPCGVPAPIRSAGSRPRNFSSSVWRPPAPPTVRSRANFSLVRAPSVITCTRPIRSWAYLLLAEA